MLGVSDWASIRRRYAAYWARANRRPVIFAEAPRDHAQWYPEERTGREAWFDTEYRVRCNRHDLGQMAFALEGYPLAMPSLGPDLLAGILGWELQYNEASEWVKHRDCSLTDIAGLDFDPQSFYYQKMEEFLTRLTEDARDDYIVGMVDLNTLFDGVAALVGAQNVCYDLVDEPEAVKRALRQHLELFKLVYTRYDAIVRRYQGGSSNWLGVYSDEPWYFLSLDFTVMLSGADYDEFVTPPLREMACFVGRSLYHLDGENAVRHLDRVLALPEITGVQVQATPAAQSVELWLPYLRRIQQAGKCCWIAAQNEDEVKRLMNELPPEGLFIKIELDTERELRHLERTVRDFYGE